MSVLPRCHFLWPPLIWPIRGRVVTALTNQRAGNSAGPWSQIMARFKISRLWWAECRAGAQGDPRAHRNNIRVNCNCKSWPQCHEWSEQIKRLDQNKNLLKLFSLRASFSSPPADCGAAGAVWVYLFHLLPLSIFSSPLSSTGAGPRRLSWHWNTARDSHAKCENYALKLKSFL